MNLSAEQIDRAHGVLLATAAGDALGAGYEFTYPAAGATIAMIGGGPFDWAPGEWTDDTSMAVGVARALAAGTGVDGVAAEFIAWYDTHPADIGNQTRTVLSHRSPSASAMTAVADGLTGRTGGNGSLMRTAPVALAYLDDEQGCVDAAGRISSLTHSDPNARQACEMWSFAILHAVLNGTYDGLRLYLDTAPNADFWRPLLDAAETGAPKDFSNNGWVVHALQTAWWAITNGSTLPESLELCVRAGGDTDTTAAIAGGLLGARWGASAVPARWIPKLHGYPSYSAYDLDALTKTLIGETT